MTNSDKQHQVIPEAAVEAAFSRIADHLDDTETESWKDLIRQALEAAAPHMWEAAYRAGHEDAATGKYRPTHE